MAVREVLDNQAILFFSHSHLQTYGLMDPVLSWLNVSVLSWLNGSVMSDPLCTFFAAPATMPQFLKRLVVEAWSHGFGIIILNPYCVHVAEPATEPCSPSIFFWGGAARVYSQTQCTHGTEPPTPGHSGTQGPRLLCLAKGEAWCVRRDFCVKWGRGGLSA